MTDNTDIDRKDMTIVRELAARARKKVHKSKTSSNQDEVQQ